MTLSACQDCTQRQMAISTEVRGMSYCDAKSWAHQMFGTCELNDQRRTSRLVGIAEQVAGNPSASLPDQMETWGDLKAAYRLFDCPDVTFAKVARGHWEHTRRRTSGRTLVICDTTELDFGKDRQITGVGPTGNGSGQGFLLHNAMMVDDGSREILGIAGQTIHHRPKKKVSKTENRTQRLRRNRESQVWGRVIDDIGKPEGDTQYVYVCDRGADNFEVFCHLRQQNSDFVIRAKAKNRKLLTADGEDITLSGLLEQMTVMGHYDLELRTRPDQPARTARIEVSTGQAMMPVPRHKSPWIKSLDPQPIAVNVVRVREVDVPEGVTAIEWLLYTSLPVETFDGVWEVIEIYEARWLVEEYHKALKSGTRVTSRQLKTAGRLEAMVGLMSVVSVRLLQLKTVASADPGRPARQVVPPLWLRMLKAVRRKLTRVHDLTVYEFYREVAKLGGFLGRKSDGEPGWITVWRGWEKLNNLVRGARLALDFESNKCG